MTELDRLRTCVALMATVTGHLDALMDQNEPGELYYDLWHEGMSFKLHATDALHHLEESMNVPPEHDPDVDNPPPF